MKSDKSKKGKAVSPEIGTEGAKKIKHFNDNKAVRISNEMYEVEKIRCKLSVHGHRLLFAIAQSINPRQTEMFPEFGFDIDAVFSYLGLEKSGKRYDQLDEALANISKNPLRIRQTTKRGGIRWSGHSWITDWNLETDSKILYLRINDRVKPYLANLKTYAIIRPKDYLKLNSEYQNWFYPYLKNKARNGTWEVAIEDLKFALFLEKTDSYNPKKNKNANQNFFTFVLGIEKPKGAYQEKKVWDYTKDKKGEYNGTLAMITKNTDVNVTAHARKTGGKYTHVVFTLSLKNDYQAIRKQQKALGTMQEKSKYKQQRSKAPKIMGDLFKGTYEMGDDTEPNGVPIATPCAKTMHYTKEKVKEMAKPFSNYTLAQFIEKMNLKQDLNGDYYKEY